MVKRKFAVLMLMAFMLAAFDGAYAQQAPDNAKPGAPAGNMLYPGAAPNLNLTEEQTAKIQELRIAFFKDTAGLRSDVYKKEQDLDVLMLEKTIDAEKAKKLQDEISGLQAQIAQKRLQGLLAARKLLTPAQIAQLTPGYNLGFGPLGRGGGMGPGGKADGGRGHGPGAR